MKTRGLIDLHLLEPGNLLAALGQSDLEGIFREATIYKSGDRGSGNGPAVLMQGSVPRDLSGIDDWHVSLPLSVLDFRILSLPFSDPATIAKVIPHELDNLVFGGSQDVVFDSVVLKNLERGSEVLVVYLKKQLLQGLLDALSRAGIDPRVVTSVELRAVLDASPEGIAEWIPFDRLSTLPVVEDLPVLLSKIRQMQRGDPPFSARSYYDERGRLIVEFAE